MPTWRTADLVATRNDDEMLITATTLTRELGDFVLAAHRRWSGSGKWLMRELAALDGDANTRYAATLADGMRAAAAGDPWRLHGDIGGILDQFGGPVFDGFHRSAPSDVGIDGE